MATYFTFNNISCKTYGLKCKEISHLSFAAKSYESIKVPGRTGNLLIDDGSYQNKEVFVEAYLDMRQIPIERPIIDYDLTDTNNPIPIYGENREDRIAAIKQWLIGHVGYKELTFDDKFTYQAIVKDTVQLEEVFTDFYSVAITFECVEVI